MAISSTDKVINKACEKKNIDKELLSSMIGFIFSEGKREFSEYNNLSIYFPGLFIFFYGKVRLIKLKSELEERIEGLKSGKEVFKEGVANYLHKMPLEKLEIVLEKVNNLLMTYKEYIDERKSTREERRKNNTKEH